MNISAITKKLAVALAVGAMSITLTATPAEAGWLDWATTAINTGATAASGSRAVAQIKKQLTAYNTTEDGRRQLFAEYKAKYGVNNDPELNYRVNNLMTNLSTAVAKVDPSIKAKPYLYFVNQNKSINAFCSLGHVMSINTGLLNLFTNDDEVAVVISHEMGHGQKDHPYTGTMSRVKRTVNTAIGVAATGSGSVGNVLGRLILTQNNAHGTKTQEKEADTLAFEYMLHSAYNPGACAAVWQRFLDKQGNNAQNALGSIFAPSDHPNNGARRDTYVKLLETYGKNKVSAKNSTVLVNGKAFMTTGETPAMSGAERSYFVLGNLAKAYHNGQNYMNVTVNDGIVYLGDQLIVRPLAGEDPAEVLAERLRSFK